jgi:hypothetical protein
MDTYTVRPGSIKTFLNFALQCHLLVSCGIKIFEVSAVAVYNYKVQASRSSRSSVGENSSNSTWISRAKFLVAPPWQCPTPQIEDHARFFGQIWIHSPWSSSVFTIFYSSRFLLVMKGDHHETIQDIQRECTAVLNVIPQKEYSDCFQKRFNRFQLCIDSEWDYFE